jgi:hypothetical protein
MAFLALCNDGTLVLRCIGRAGVLDTARIGSFDFRKFRTDRWELRVVDCWPRGDGGSLEKGREDVVILDARFNRVPGQAIVYGDVYKYE